MELMRLGVDLVPSHAAMRHHVEAESHLPMELHFQSKEFRSDYVFEHHAGIGRVVLVAC